MKLNKDFTLNRPRDEVWTFFHDVPAVAACLPGAEYLALKEDGSHSGRMAMKVGPFQAAFEGVANATYDEAAHSVAMDGKGVDKKGASRGKMKMTCALHEEGAQTRVTVDADVQLSGTIAQFGRTGIIEEIAGVLISDFVSNVEAALSPAATAPAAAEGEDAPAATPREKPREAPKPAPISGLRLLWLSIRGWGRSLFTKRT